jgi:UDP-3-O-[3-hydroxymyristoyl] glucosamine N-acyltransferase|tara:strand:- start:145605 stop:146636 length:1032 start_codon:yes stop_codon:yes gene_type:complete
MEIELSIEAIRSVLPDAEFQGSGPKSLSGIASVDTALAGDLTFISKPKFAKQLSETAASAVIIPKSLDVVPQSDQWLIRVEHPSVALAHICGLVEQGQKVMPPAGVHPSAFIDPTAKIAESASIGPLVVIEGGAVVGEGAVVQSHCYLGRDVVVGADCWLYPHISIQSYCSIGDRCILHSGVVLGSDGFGYESGPSGHMKSPQIGTVEIGNDVEIGANSSIDRARFSATKVGHGTKIDNLVQIGHNCEIGQHCILCAFVGLAGTTKLGDFVVLAGQVGTAGHLEIGDQSIVGGQAGVAKSLEGGKAYAGSPAIAFQAQRRIESYQRRLPELFTRLKAIEKSVS